MPENQKTCYCGLTPVKDFPNFMFTYEVSLNMESYSVAFNN